MDNINIDGVIEVIVAGPRGASATDGSAGAGLTMVQGLPAASLLWFQKVAFNVNDSREYICVANHLGPTSDEQCFWLQR